MQNGKLRLIDDLSEYGLNQCFLSRERIALGGVDEVVSLAKLWLDSVTASRQVVIELSDGTLLKGKLHPSWSLGQGCVVVF